MFPYEAQGSSHCAGESDWEEDEQGQIIESAGACAFSEGLTGTPIILAGAFLNLTCRSL
jgi:hypothetical protein